MRLRYTGQLPVTFVALDLEVVPGAEFEIDDVDARLMLARADVVEVQPPVRRKAAPAAVPEPAGMPAADVTEEV